MVSHKWQGKYEETGKGISKVYKAAGRYSAGSPINLYFDGEYREIANIESCLPINKEITTNLDCKTLAGGKFVSYIHIGPYDKIGESYEKVFGYINEHKLTTELPTREVYLKGPGMIFKGSPEKYMTEILVKVTE